MDKEQSNRLKERLKKLLRRQPGFVKLRSKLLKIGGKEVVPVEEELIRNILNRGQIWSGKSATIVKGTPCRCHENSAHLWMKDADHQKIVTGWALSSDGLWRQHTWILKNNKKIIETTVSREKYFGFELTILESLRFIHANADHDKAEAFLIG